MTRNDRKPHWVIIFGTCFPTHPSPKNYAKFVGTPVLDRPTNKPRSFQLRVEAGKFAKEFAKKYGNHWEVDVVKFNKRTIKKNPYETQWGVRLGEPTAHNPCPKKHLIGQWVDPDIGACGITPGILFFTKQEARDFCVARSKIKAWNYYPEKYHPRRAT